nr:TetR/AcrR family transcriptional regulator [Paraburkholderia sp. BL8N3]
MTKNNIKGLNKPLFTIRERLEIAQHHLKRDHPTEPISLSRLCREAGVSRSSVYEHHPDLVHLFQRPCKKRVESSASRTQEVAKLKQNLAKLREQNTALLYLFLEKQLAENSEAQPVINHPAQAGKADKISGSTRSVSGADTRAKKNQK